MPETKPEKADDIYSVGFCASCGERRVIFKSDNRCCTCRSGKK